MIIKAQKFTPEVLLSAPRRGPAVPNHDGSLALFAVSTYSFETKKTAKEIRVLDIKTGTSALFTDDETAHDVNWLGDGTNAIIWLQSGAKGITSLMVGDGEDPSKASYTADVILAPFCDLKLKALDDRTIACVMSGKATTEGKLYNEETAEKSPSTARIYDELRVRFWDRYLTPEKTVLWYSKLVKKDGKYSLAAPVHNALKGTDFECPSYNPLGSGVDEFDICTNGIIFRAADPTANAALGRPADIYFLPLSSFTEEKPPALERITTGSYFGEASNPRFSPCGKRIAFLKTTDESSMFPRLMLVPDLKESLEAMDLLNSAAGKPWNLSPGGFEWSKDGKSLLVTADDCGRVVLFDLPLNEGRNLIFRPLTQDGVVSGFYPLGDSGRLLVSSSSLVESSKYSVIDTSEPLNQHVVSTASKNGLKLGLSPKQVSDMYFEGAGDYCVQAFIVKPRSFDENKKYPLALLIHGGPEDAWREAWSTRWNPACWAEQGYVCVMPNVTGSVGFGKEFTEGIFNSWGGRPYEDLIKCFEYVKKNMPFVDTDNAIAAGGSYGGYMANWIAGNPFAKEFKAIVSHDGVFSTQYFLAGDEFGGENDFGGPMFPWKNYENMEKYNPARPDLLGNWKTPMLIIHSDLDYRCLLSDGMAAFGVLQALGTPSRFLNFPDEGHWVLKPENSLVWHKTVFDWINKYSGITAKREAEEAEAVGRAMSHLTV